MPPSDLDPEQVQLAINAHRIYRNSHPGWPSSELLARAAEHWLAAVAESATPPCAYEEFGWCATHQHAMKACPHGIVAAEARSRLAALEEVAQMARRTLMPLTEGAYSTGYGEALRIMEQRIRALVEKVTP